MVRTFDYPRYTYGSGTQLYDFLQGDDCPIFKKYYSIIGVSSSNMFDYYSKTRGSYHVPIKYDAGGSGRYFNFQGLDYNYSTTSVRIDYLYGNGSLGDNGCKVTYAEVEGTDCDIVGISQAIFPQMHLSTIFSDDMDILLGSDGYTNSNHKTHCLISTDASNNIISGDIPNYITAKNKLGENLTTEFVAQPIVIGGIKTPLYSITGNQETTSPDLYTEVVVDGTRFFMVDSFIGVKC